MVIAVISKISIILHVSNSEMRANGARERITDEL